MWATGNYSDNRTVLEFVHSLGESEVCEDILKAYTWACINKFVAGIDDRAMQDVDVTAYTDRQKQLAEAVSFSSPMSLDEAKQTAVYLQGIVCCPKHLWTEELRPCWVVCLSN